MYLILLLFAHLIQTPQQDITSFEFLNTSAGLSNNIVYDIHQDSEGFIWIATDNGFNRYDGYTFDTFYHTVNDSTSISSNIVRTILEDHQGNLWIGTKNGLNVYHKESQSFTNYNTTLDNFFVNLDIKELAIDKKGNIWFNTLRVFGYFDPKEEEFEFIQPSYHSFSMTQQKDESLWISSESGEISQLMFDTNQLISKGQASDFSRKQIYYGPYSEKLWLPPTENKDMIDPTMISIPELPNNLLPTKLLEIDTNILLIGTTEGLFEYHKNTDKLKKWQLGKESSTLNQQVKSIYQDENGGIWIGTLGGIYHYDPFGKPFKHVDIDPAFDDIVMGMKKTQKGTYVNTLGKAVYKISSDGGSTKKITVPARFSPGGSFIWAIEEVPENKFPIWMATDNGLLCYDPEKNKFKEIPLPFYEDKVKSTFTLLNTESDHIWAASGKAIHLLSKKRGIVLKSYPLYDTLKETNLQKMILLNDQFFVGTEGGGLYTFNEETHQLLKLNVVQNHKSSEPFSPTVWDLHVVSDTLWIGTNKGLYRLNAKTLEIDLVFNDNHIIFSISHDDQGRLWMGSEKGLISYEPDEDVLKFYGIEDGIQNIEFNRRSTIRATDGELWFGGINGITVFDPTTIKSNTVAPPVYITTIQAITADSTFSIPRENKQIKLPWYHNTITLDYVALNYTNAFQNQYKYQMKGYDPDWVINNISRQARYVQLPPGQYTFQVIGSNNDGVWNNIGDQISIEILPPYWETWWFRSCIFFLIIISIWILYRYRVRKLLEVERMKLRIAGDLHDEIGSGLSGIALTGDILKQQVESDEIKPHLINRITNNARVLASNLDDIVWLINPKKETLGDLIVKIKTITQELLYHITIDFKEQVSDTYKKKVLSADFKRNLLLLSKEAIHNISKHADTDQAEISIQLKDHMLYLIFKDHGKGFDSTLTNNGHGLMNMKHRAQLVKANLNIESKVTQGTEIHIQVKIP